MCVTVSDKDPSWLGEVVVLLLAVFLVIVLWFLGILWLAHQPPCSGC